MKSAFPSVLAALTLIVGCAPGPASQRVEVWEGEAQILVFRQQYRLTFTVNDVTHELKGTLENRSSGDRFLVAGTSLPVRGGAELSMNVTAQDGVRLNASILGFGITNVALKSNAVLSARQEGRRMTGTLNVNGVPYGLSLTRVQ